VKIASVANAVRQLERSARRAGIATDAAGPEWLPPGARAKFARIDLDLFDDVELDKCARLLERLEVNERDEEARVEILGLFERTQSGTAPPPRPQRLATPAEALRAEVVEEREVRSDPRLLRCGDVAIRLAFDPFAGGSRRSQSAWSPSLGRSSPRLPGR
jgi:hypothetical protein